MFQKDAELFQAFGGSELAPFAPEYRADHWAQGPLIPWQSTRSGGAEIWNGSAWVPNTHGPAPASGGGGSQLVPWQSTREGGKLIWDGASWVPNTGRGRGRGGKTVTQTVVFSDGSFRTYYSDGSYSKGYRGQPYPPGPVTRDVATQPLGPRFSLAVLGTDAFRVDNITNERHPLGQLMPDGRVLVGSILYHPRPDGTLEWVGPPAVGANPQADANLAALQAAVTIEAQKTATLAAAVERAETDKLARQHRQYQSRLPGGGGGVGQIGSVPGAGWGVAPIPAGGGGGGGVGQIGSAPGAGWGVAPTPVPMMPTTTALPQSMGMRPPYVIAASSQPSGPSLEEIAAVTAEAAYQGAETALAEAEFYATPQATEVVLVEQFDVFGGDPTGGGLGFGYHDPRSE
jgi:hypothetical protein